MTGEIRVTREDKGFMLRRQRSRAAFDEQWPLSAVALATLWFDIAVQLARWPNAEGLIQSALTRIEFRTRPHRRVRRRT